MVASFHPVLLLLSLLAPSRCTTISSPCPDVFQYHRDESGKWFSTIQRRVCPTSTPFYIEVQVGFYSNEKLGEDARLNLSCKILQTYRLKCELKWQSDFPVARVLSVKLNGNIICEGNYVNQDKRYSCIYTLRKTETFHPSTAISYESSEDFDCFRYSTPVCKTYWETPPSSPCPEVFQYRYDGSSWNSVILVSCPRTSSVVLEADVVLYGVLLKEGETEVKLHSDDPNARDKLLNGESIEYNISWNSRVPLPIPVITSINVNGDPICYGERVKEDCKHTRFTVGKKMWKEPCFEQTSRPRPFYTEIPRTQPTTRPTMRPTTRPTTRLRRRLTTQPTTQPTTRPITERSTKIMTVKRGSLDDQCGQSMVPIPLVHKANNTAWGDWPWVVALFYYRQLSLDTYWCSGSLINTRYFITAAHCIHEKTKEKINAEDVIAVMGMYDLSKIENSHQFRDVEQFMIHPSWNSSNGNYDADLAVGKLRTVAEYSSYVRSICTGNCFMDIISVKEGMVASWGMNENDDVNTQLKSLQLPIVNAQECRKSHKRFEAQVSDGMFCAGARNGAGPCEGDSGAGLFLQVFFGEQVRWCLRGVVSFGVKNDEDGRCDLTQYVAFTDVAKYTDWLIQFSDN